jgi:hypothetical protein
MADYSWAQSMDGTDWEEEIFLLLQIRHGPQNIQRVPSQDQGDLGLDSYCVSDGTVYQYYAPEGILSIRDRYIRHRDKITEDIGKFIDRKDRIAALLGNLVVPRWILVVPLNDSKEILIHAATKAELVRQTGRTYVAPEFQILVQDAADFTIERRKSLSSGIQTLDLRADEVEDELVEQWTNNNNSLVANLRRKLTAVYPTETNEYLAERVQFLVAAFIQGENLLAALNADHPEVWEKVQEQIRRTERRLRFMGRGVTSAPANLMREEVSAFKAALHETQILVSASTAETLSFGKVSDWLLRCPLDFPEVS